MPLPPKMVGDFGKKDFYAVLNISPQASPAEIPQAYRRAALLAHPDKGGSGEAFQLVAHAFEVLACTSSRKLYDEARNCSMSFIDAGVVATQSKHDDARRVFSAVSRCRPDHGDTGVKRSAPEAGPSPKKQRTCSLSKDTARTRPTKPESAESVKSKRSQRTPEKALLAALERLKNVLQAMCVEQRRHSIAEMSRCVRTVLLVFMEKVKHQAMAKSTKQKGKADLQLEYPGCGARYSDPISVGNTSSDRTVMDRNEVEPVARGPSSHALLRLSGTDSSRQTHCAAAGNCVPFVQNGNFDFAQWKEQVSTSTMTGIQCKKGRYKAHLHVKSFRVYTNSHPTIEMAIDHQIILMQIRSAWIAAWQSNPKMWEEHPEQLALLCNQVLEANGTSESRMGLKAFVSMEARAWLGKNCFVISPVMELVKALEWQARLLRARRVTWLVFRAEWIRLMQCERLAQAKVRSAEEAEHFADAAYERHQHFIIQHVLERKKREEARRLAQQQRREREERERQILREKRMQDRSARQKAKAHALLEKRLVKAVRSVERALELKARSDARRWRGEKTHNAAAKVPHQV